MSSYVQTVIEARYTRLGISPEIARSEAGKEIAMLIAMGLISAKTVEAVDRDAQVHDLRGKGLTCTVIGVRMSISRTCIFEAIRRHVRRRRAVLRMTA